MLLTEPKTEFKSMHADLAASLASQHGAVFDFIVQRECSQGQHVPLA